MATKRKHKKNVEEEVYRGAMSYRPGTKIVVWVCILALFITGVVASLGNISADIFAPPVDTSQGEVIILDQ